MSFAIFRGSLSCPLRLSSRRLLATVAHPENLTGTSLIRHDWTRKEIQNIYDSPLLDLAFRAATIHRQNHDPSKIQLCTLMNIKSMVPPLYHQA
jgi:biotin synthase